jgi:hypothetical protein
MKSAPWVPPRPAYHLRVFAVSLAAVVLSLVFFLFGVSLEAVTPATGTIQARDQQELRTPIAGLVEPGWYEDTLAANDQPVAVRLDRQGDGLTDPAVGPSRTVHVNSEGKPFHALRPGDALWPGQVAAVVRPDYGHHQLTQIEESLRLLEDRGDSGALLGQVRALRDLVRQQFSQAVLRAPDTAERWLALNVRVSPAQAVQAGDVIATLVPLDSQTGQPRDLVTRLDVEESHSGFVEAGQTVRLYSPMYNQRLHGWAEARIERLEPHGEVMANGERHFHVWAAVTHSPFPLRLGSSCKADIVVGRKPVYRIILEH